MGEYEEAYFENGVRANFTLRAGGAQSTRRITVYFERGHVSGNMWRGKITKTTYTGRKQENIIEEIDTSQLGGHGGGDPRLIKDFFEKIKSQNDKENLTSAQRSLQSHLMAFAAEISRKSGKHGKVVDFKEYLRKFGLKK